MLEGTRGFLRALLGGPDGGGGCLAERLLRWRQLLQDDSVVGQLLPGLSAFDGAAAATACRLAWVRFPFGVA